MLVKPEIKKGLKPLFFKAGKLIFSRGNYIFESELFENNKNNLVAYFQDNSIKQFISRIHFLSKTFRYGFRSVKPYKNGLIGIHKNKILFKSKNQKKMKTVFTSFKGSRPLNLLICPNEKIYFGEYFSNKNRSSVKVFSSKNGKDWFEVYKFNPGSIRHIHNLKYDKYRKGIWVLTGDSNNESGLWFTSDNFKTLKKIVNKGQSSRAVDIFINKNDLIIPMDSPVQKNYIYKYSFKTGTMKKICFIENSIFNLIKINDLFLISTVPEPSKINDTSNVYIYASLDCEKWIKISVFKKNILPSFIQKYFRYPEVEFCKGKGMLNVIGYGRSLKGFSNCMMIWKIKDIKKILNENKKN
ncbi:MAG: hypothetical protein CMG01_01510 [Candidatus Marinimicrobia bacterium]|nr:hypothetical protein [Candidatus Neomarinimicrobiota bacterium]|tara:strand:- start:6505 stop:7569 length:1065 start_codon:yes stop_codon:yes gene_type:complete